MLAKYIKDKTEWMVREKILVNVDQNINWLTDDMPR